MLPLHQIKRSYQRLLVNSRTSKKTPRSPFEKEALQICRNLLRNSSTELQVCPETGRKFIVSHEMKIKVIVSDDKIVISSPTYREVSVSEHGLNTITQIFNGSVKAKIDTFEENIKQVDQTSINDIVTLTSYLST